MTVELNCSLCMTFNRIPAVLNTFIKQLVKKQEKYLRNLPSACLKRAYLFYFIKSKCENSWITAIIVFWH